MPKVSIGLPVYNGENFIEAALDSLLNQTFEDFELIISDNASTDRTEEICRTYVAKDKRLRYVRSETNLGAARNFNHVFELSSGQYFKWAAHDDICAPSFVERCVSVLDQDSSVSLAFSKTKFIDKHGKFLHDYNYRLRVSSPKPSQRFFDLVVANHIVVEAFGVIPSSLLKRTPLLGGYVGSDRVMLSELALHGRFFEIPDYLFFHREHPLRSTKAFPGLHERVAWFDPAKAHTVVYPTWKLLAAHLASIGKVPLSPLERLQCYGQMGRWIRSQKLSLVGDVMMSLRRTLGRNAARRAISSI
jgi:glycosyltransferase involved in cell wall biosynthesis